MTNPEITPEKIADTIDQAADVLESRGWCYGQLSKYDHDTQRYSFCTIGALVEVETDWRTRKEAEKQLACALSKLSDGAPVAGSQSYPKIAMWNDRHRNGKNVIAKLRKAAAKIRSGECS